MAGSDKEELGPIIAYIKAVGLDITEYGDIEDFIGVNIDKMDSDTYHLSQPKIINQIVFDLVLSKYNVTPRNTPDLTTNILGKCQDAEKLDQRFQYHSVIVKLKYL